MAKRTVTRVYEPKTKKELRDFCENLHKKGIKFRRENSTIIYKVEEAA